MINLSQEEFEKQIQRLIKGEISRKNLAKELETDLRTLNNRIIRLAEVNPELYKRYIEKFPYRSKTRDNIDYEALIIEAMKTRSSLKEIANKYNVSIRTITRRIKELEKEGSELIKLYRVYAKSLKEKKDIPFDFKQKIEDLELGTVKLSEINEKKQREMEDIIRKFEELIGTGISKAEAARRLGYDGYPTIWKLYQALDRINTENNNINNREKETFRQGLKVETTEGVSIREEEGIERKDRELGGE